MLSKRSFGLSLPCYVLRDLSTPRRNCICIEEMRINPSEISCLSQLQEIIKTFRAKLCMYTFRYLSVNRVKLGRKLNPPRDFTRSIYHVPCRIVEWHAVIFHVLRQAPECKSLSLHLLSVSLCIRAFQQSYTQRRKKKKKKETVTR